MLPQRHDDDPTAGVEAWVSRGEVRRDCVGLRASFGNCGIRSQTSEHAHRPRPAREAAAAGRIGAKRKPDVRRSRKREKRKTRRQHTDDFHRAIVQRQRGADRRRGASEAALPQAVADDGDPIGSRLVFPRGEGPADCRPDRENIEEARRHHSPLHVLGFATRYRAASQRPRPHRIEGAYAKAQILEVGLREWKLGLSLLRLAAPEEDEPLRVGKRHRVQHDTVDDGEHRGRPPDADGKEEDGGGCKTRGAQQCPRGVAKVCKHCDGGESEAAARRAVATELTLFQ